MGVLRNVTTGKIVAGNVRLADSLWRRLTGMIPYDQIGPDDGLWLDRCSAIHTVGMRASIDVVFLDKACRIIRVRQGIPRCRLVVTCPGARTVVELGAARQTARDLLAGDQLALE